MREILFRGKRKDNGEWVEGYYSYANDGHGTELYMVGEKVTGVYYPVIPDTVGQYTGLTDENGKKIFEGDVVREYGGEYAQGFYEIDGNLIVEIPNTLANFILGSDCGCKYKIIGNIHDNPEIMEGGGNND